VSAPGDGHVAYFIPAPWTRVQLLHIAFSRSLAHTLEIWTADIISAVEFDTTGNYLATGDKGGRVVLFERNDMVCIPLFPPSLPPLSLYPLYRRSLVSSPDLSVNHFDILEKELRIQILYRVSVTRARV